MKMNLKKMSFPVGVFVMLMMLVGLSGCDSTTNIEDYINEQSDAPAYNPSQKVTIGDFTPSSGSVGQQLVIYGSNFGNDPSLVKVVIGGKPAPVVSVNGDCLYTFIPSKSFTGEIVITVGEGAQAQTVTADKNFTYDRKMVVGKLCGYKLPDDSQGWIDGPFETCAGFRNDGVMQFSPYNHDQLFIVYDQEPHFGTVAHGVQLLDLKEKTVRTILPLGMFSNQRLRTIDFAVDPFAYEEDGTLVDYANSGWISTATPDQKKWREHLILSADNGDSDRRTQSVYIVDRDGKGDFSADSRVRQLANYVQCNGASLQPSDDGISHELYFTSYADGEFLRLDMDAYWRCIFNEETWNPYVKDNELNQFESLFKVQDTGWEFQIDIHPTGNYAYIVVINQQYILRTDYSKDQRRYMNPYVVAGSQGVPGFVDGVGQSTRFARPYQGTFVKNDAYEAAGKSDVYDFYICDNSWDPNHTGDPGNEVHAIRYLTPEGVVRTYAGGSRSTHSDNVPYGAENGELRDVARFDRPTGLVNDFHIDKVTGEKTLIFYILDTMNRAIRTITMEGSDEELDDDEPIENN